MLKCIILATWKVVFLLRFMCFVQAIETDYYIIAIFSTHDIIFLTNFNTCSIHTPNTYT